MSNDNASSTKSIAIIEPSAPPLNAIPRAWTVEAPPPVYSERVISSQPGFIINPARNADHCVSEDSDDNSSVSCSDSEESDDEDVVCWDCTTRERQQRCLNCVCCCCIIWVSCCQILLLFLDSGQPSHRSPRLSSLRTTRKLRTPPRLHSRAR